MAENSLAQKLRKKADEILAQQRATITTKTGEGQTTSVELGRYEEAVKLYREADRLDQQAQQLALPGYDPKSVPDSVVPGQAEAKRGLAYFKIYYADIFPNFDDAIQLTAQGWGLDKALLIVYLATPKERRVPRTMALLASELGKTSPRVFSTWRKKYPIDLAARQYARQKAEEPEPDKLAKVVAAAYDSAAILGREGHADRKMVLQMLGLLQEQPVGKPGGPPQEDEEISDDEELNTYLTNLLIAATSQAQVGQADDEEAAELAA